MGQRQAAGGPRAHEPRRLPDDAAPHAAPGRAYAAGGWGGPGAGGGRADRIFLECSGRGRPCRLSRRGDAYGRICEPHGKECSVNTRTSFVVRRAWAPLALALLSGCGYNTIQTMDE